MSTSSLDLLQHLDFDFDNQGEDFQNAPAFCIHSHLIVLRNSSSSVLSDAYLLARSARGTISGSKCCMQGASVPEPATGLPHKKVQSWEKL